MSLTAADICRAALLDLNVFEPSDSVSNDDLAFVLTKLNRILDNWNADRTAVYADQFVTSTLTAALSPHLIGPTGSLTFVVTQRPVSIEGAVLIYATANAPQVALTLRDAAWYRSLSIPSLSTAIPTDLYYEPDWPNGKLYFYPVPSAALRVTLWTRIVLSQLATHRHVHAATGLSGRAHAHAVRRHRDGLRETDPREPHAEGAGSPRAGVPEQRRCAAAVDAGQRDADVGRAWQQRDVLLRLVGQVVPSYPGFIGGSLPSQSALATSERTVNFYKERISTQGTQHKEALYPTPGFQTWNATPTTDLGGRAALSIDSRTFVMMGAGPLSSESNRADADEARDALAGRQPRADRLQRPDWRATLHLDGHQRLQLRDRLRGAHHRPDR
jgi:hypothetical protein